MLDIVVPHGRRTEDGLEDWPHSMTLADIAQFGDIQALPIAFQEFQDVSL